MTFHIITLFPESFDSYVGSSIIGRAIRDKKIKIKFYNPRDYTKDKHRRVDQKPYGGGPGMVLEAPSIIKVVDKILKGLRNTKKVSILWPSPSGKKFDNKQAETLSKKSDDIVIICGRYEGVDARVRKIFKATQVSIGDYTVTGGELPAMIIMDTVSRRIPGVLGKLESVEERRVASSDTYTRPEVLEYKGKKYRVPKVLLSGNHRKIEEWRSKNR